MDDDSSTRRQGVDFGSLEEELPSIDYPTTVTTLRDELGDRSIELGDEEQRLETVLEPHLADQGDDVVFDSPDDVQTEILNLVGAEAVGREGYSDRGIDSDDREREPESL